MLNISRSSNISIVQGCSIQCLGDLLNSTFCVSASILRCWQERCQSSRFHTDSQQRHFLLILVYFKSSKILPRNLYQAFPVCHWPECGHLLILHSIPVTEEMFVYWLTWALVPQSISNKGLGTPWLALTTRIIPQAVIRPRNYVSAM